MAKSGYHQPDPSQGHLLSLITINLNRFRGVSRSLQVNSSFPHFKWGTTLKDVVTLCETGEFEPQILLDFIRSDRT
jgi:hypothetical protein